MRKLEEELAEVENHLANLIRYAIDYFKNLLQKYGKGKERKTEIKNFNTITATVVAAANQKLYVNRTDGFIGYSLKKDEFVMDCSDIDDIIIFRLDGTCIVTKVQEKVFVGKDIIYCSVFKKNDDRKVFNLVYLDAKSGVSYVKRFKVTSVTRDREYRLVGSHAKSKITYFSANDNGEAEVIQLNLTANCTAKIKQFDYDFAKLAIKGRESLGNMLTKYPVRKITQKSAGVSTLGGVNIWYDPTIGRLNRDQHGDHIGNFEPSDYILAIYRSGNYELTNFELTNRYPAEDILYLKKFNPKAIVSGIYFDGVNKTHFIKRFKLETSTIDKKFLFISDHKASKLLSVTDNYSPNVQIKHKPDGKTNEVIILPISEIVEVRGWKAIGSKLNYPKLVDALFIETEVKAEEEAETNFSDEDHEAADVKNLSGSIMPDSENGNIANEKETEEEMNGSENTAAENTSEDENLSEAKAALEKVQDEIPLIINSPVNSEIDDIPFEIKNTDPEHLPKDSNNGDQLGLF
jgi:topoisomerase-4 subunit A